MLRDGILVVLAFGFPIVATTLLSLATAPVDHPAVGWLARIAHVERNQVPRLVLVVGGVMLLLALSAGILLFRSIAVD